MRLIAVFFGAALFVSGACDALAIDGACERQDIKDQEPQLVASNGETLYGGETIEEWKKKFAVKNAERAELKFEWNIKRLYVDVYERGWVMRYMCSESIRTGKLVAPPEHMRSIDIKTVKEGRLYTDEEIAAYDVFKKDVERIEKRLEELDKEISKIERDAKYYGVPFEAWR